MKSRLLAILTFLLSLPPLMAGGWDWWGLPITDSVVTRDTLLYQVQALGVASSGRFAPFWLQSNRNGNISASPYSGNLTAGIIKPATSPQRWFDYDFGVQLTGRAQSAIADSPWSTQRRPLTGYFNLLYAHARLYIVDITAGVLPMVYETVDEQLSTGSMVFSGNSQPLPRVTIGIDHYTPFPGCYGYFEIKGGLTHAWLADNVYVSRAFLHHKFAGVRFGGRLPVNVAYEFHHAAQWGGTSPVYGDLGNDWQSYKNVFFARAGGTMRNDQLNAQGNHVGSQQLSLIAKGSEWRITAYWQNFLEDNFAFLGLGKNLTDGLWGISLTQTRWRYIEGVTYELLNTTSQSGPWHDRDGLCYAGNDSYYRNGVYVNGWNYWYRSMGTPFITSPLYNINGTVYTLNSRVRVHHIGLRGDICDFRYRALCSYARNYGNDCRFLRLQSANTACLLEVTKHVEKAWGLDFSLSLAADFGTQFGNQFGALLSITKTGLITSW